MKYSQLRNAEFKQGSDFLKLLTDYKETNEIINFNSFYAVYHKEGLYLFSPDEVELSGFVLDSENIVDKELYQNNTLLIIEKYFRIYIKLDLKYPLSNSEIHISGTSNYIVNPFSYSNNEFIKYIINTNPDPKRDTARNIRLFLNTKDGTGTLDTESFYKTNYKKVKDNFLTVRELISEKETIKTITQNDSFFEYSEEKCIDLISNYIGYSKYSSYLTETQKKVVYSDSLGPIRIIGPAGSGKTLSLILKALFLAKKYQQENKSLRLAFVCHSEAMKAYIKNILSFDGNSFLSEENSVSITVVTLLEWCCKFAIKDFSLTDCLEVDSTDTKIMQEMLLDAALKKFLEYDFSTFEPYISNKLVLFFNNPNKPKIVELLKNEISIYIKGPNVDNIDAYFNSAKNSKLIPIHKKEDYAAIYRIYEIYQQSLIDLGKYDIDDVSSVALGFLSRAIWKRNRKFNGFDAILVDELHLYDFSEISILKYMLKEENSNHIISATDISQSSSDLEIISANINSLDTSEQTNNELNVVFRSSQSIINLTKFLFTNNISLFTNGNPLQNAQVLQNDEGETPVYIHDLKDDGLYNVLTNMDFIKNHKRSNSLVICTDFQQKELLISILEKQHIPFIDIKNRNDFETVRKAQKDSMLVIGYIDFIGGLEFENVCILGFDIDKIPPVDNTMSVEFFKHIWYRKIYVAFTRAKKKLFIFSNELKGKHPFIEAALSKQLLQDYKRD